MGAVIGAYSYLFFVSFHIPKPVAKSVNNDMWETDQENGLKPIAERLL